jgi:ribosomal protein S18 acetylase RimI-like enzyme
MGDVIVRNYQASDIEKLARFFERYQGAFPDAKLAPPEYYTYHPTLAGGQNVFCALDYQERIVGFAPVFPAPATEESEPEEPHHIWTIVLADPGAPDAAQARTLLLDCVIERAKAIKASFTSRRVKLAADMMASQRPDIQHLLENGFERYEGMYVMRRTTADPIPDVSVPPEITVRLWKMTTEEEQKAYMRAYNSCFFELPKTLEALRFFLNSPVWAAGTAVAAFDPQGQLVGSIVAYRDEEAGWGVVDDVFVLPGWRRRGIARRLVGEGIRYLREQDVQEVRLDVLRSNEPAISLYRSMGYVTINEEVMLGLYI